MREGGAISTTVKCMLFLFYSSYDLSFFSITFVSWAQIHSHFMGVKSRYSVGLKSAQALGCPCSVKCLFKDIRSALTPSRPLLLCLHSKRVLEISTQIQMCFTKRKDLPQSTLSVGSGGGYWIANYGVDYEIRSYSTPAYRVPAIHHVFLWIQSQVAALMSSAT